MAHDKPLLKSNGVPTAHSLSTFVKAICDIMRRSNCASALQYVPELTWILFLRLLDDQETREREESEALGLKNYRPTLSEPYRWQDWGAPYSNMDNHPITPEGKSIGWKRNELFAAGSGRLLDFINNDLLPTLHELDVDPNTGLPKHNATPKQRIIGRIMTAVEKVRVDTETNLLDIFDRVHEINVDHYDETHYFTLSHVYEDLLLKMGEKNSDGGQFFTPREVIRSMVLTIDPSLGNTIYDPCCGTGGFLAVACEHISRKLGESPLSTDLELLNHNTFFGREKENLVFPITLANLVLHGIDEPKIWHGNALTNTATYDALFDGAPEKFDIILTNPPFGGKEGKNAQKNFDFETSATQVLFVQKILEELAPEGTCAVVLDEGMLFRVNESAFVETKRKLVDECDLWCVVSLPGGVFTAVGASVKTNLLFFTKGKQTDSIWYYDLSHVKVGKKLPLTLAHFGFDRNGEVLSDSDLPQNLTSDWFENETTKNSPFPSYARLLAKRGTDEANSRYSWTVNFGKRRAQARKKQNDIQEKVLLNKLEIGKLKEKLKRQKKKNVSRKMLSELTRSIQDLERVCRTLQSNIIKLDAAVFDLKAVNPNFESVVDHRSVSEIIESIHKHGKVVTHSLEQISNVIEPKN